MLSKDGWGGLAVAAASLFLFWLTIGLKESPLVPIGPGFYPRFVLGLTALLAAVLVILDLRRKKAPFGKSTLNYSLVALSFAAFGVYVAVLPYLGYRIATALYVAAASALISFPRGAKGWTGLAALAFGTAALTWLVFERYLTVLLPRGRWTDF